MPIQNDAELAETVVEAGNLLQLIQDYCPRESNATIAKVRFPRGFILAADTHRRDFSFIRDAHSRLVDLVRAGERGKVQRKRGRRTE